MPIYEQFFHAVRDVNATRPRDRQLRVLLGDPPLDWSTLNTPDDFVRFMKTTDAIRSAHPAQIIERDVIKRNHRALVIYGEAHFGRVAPGSSRSLIRRLEDSGAKAFTISIRTTIGGDLRTLQPNVASWRIPSLAVLRGTTLGAASYRFYMPYFGPPERDPLRDLRMEEQFDALLYVGPREAMSQSQLSPNLCGDATYIELRIRRMELVSQTTPGGASGPIMRLKESCAAVGTGR